jgi:hypothetical protein
MGGGLGGKFLNCTLMPQSFNLPPGRYKVSAPMRNSVFGMFALITPAEGWEKWVAVESGHKWLGPVAGDKWIGASGQKWLGPSSEKWLGPSGEKWLGPVSHEKWLGASGQKWLGPSGEKWLGPVSHEKWLGPVSHEKWLGPVSHEKWLGPSGEKWTGTESGKLSLDPAMTGEVAVLTDRQLPGKKCVVVTAQFADLMDALQAAGGAHISAF